MCRDCDSGDHNCEAAPAPSVRMVTVPEDMMNALLDAAWEVVTGGRDSEDYDLLFVTTRAARRAVLDYLEKPQ